MAKEISGIFFFTLTVSIHYHELCNCQDHKRCLHHILSYLQVMEKSNLKEFRLNCRGSCFYSYLGHRRNSKTPERQECF